MATTDYIAQNIVNGVLTLDGQDWPVYNGKVISSDDFAVDFYQINKGGKVELQIIATANIRVTFRATRLDAAYNYVDLIPGTYVFIIRNNGTTVTVEDAESGVGGIRKFTTTIDPTNSVTALTPAPASGQFWQLHNVTYVAVGGSVPYTDLTGGNVAIKIGYESMVISDMSILLYDESVFDLTALAEGDKAFAVDYYGNATALYPLAGDKLVQSFGSYGGLKTFTITDGGANHQVGDVITMTNSNGGTLATVTVTEVDGGGVVTAATITTTGDAYVINANEYFDSSTGAGTEFVTIVTSVQPLADGNGTIKAIVWASLETV
jgi:hypothetical protein